MIVVGPFAVPASDLRCLAIEPVGFRAARGSLALGGLLVPGLLWTVAAVSGVATQLAFPSVVCVASAQASSHLHSCAKAGQYSFHASDLPEGVQPITSVLVTRE